MIDIRLTDEQIALITNKLGANRRHADNSNADNGDADNGGATRLKVDWAGESSNDRRTLENLLYTVLTDLRALAVAVDARAPRRGVMARIGAIVDGIENTLAES